MNKLLLAILILLAQCKSQSGSELKYSSISDSTTTQSLKKDNKSIPEESECPSVYKYKKDIKYKTEVLHICADTLLVTGRFESGFIICSAKDSVIFENEIDDFKFLKLESPLEMVQYVDLYDEGKDLWEKIPAVKYVIQEVDKNFVVEENFILKHAKFSEAQIENLIATNDRYKEEKIQVNLELYVNNIFIAATNGNKACLNIFKKMPDVFPLDGASAETYMGLLPLLELYEKDKNLKPL